LAVNASFNHFFQSFAALFFESFHQAVIRLIELFDTFISQLPGDPIDVNIDLRQHPARFFETFFQSGSRLAMIAIGTECFLRHHAPDGDSLQGSQTRAFHPRNRTGAEIISFGERTEWPGGLRQGDGSSWNISFI
jgi:hypothetical protein